MRIKPLLLSLFLAISMVAFAQEPKPQEAPKCYTVDNIRDLIKLSRESGALTTIRICSIR